MLKPIFANNEIYHVYNRGVEKRSIFSNDKDRFRFIHNLYEFNDTAPAERHPEYPVAEVRPRQIQRGKQKTQTRKPRKLLVEILAFCLMPNHYHILVRQKVDGGVVQFMKKIGTGYTMYFNKKYERVGPLFQGSFKAIHVDQEMYFVYLPYYIHLNPLDLVEPEWREGTIHDYKTAERFLNEYRWSSYLDYTGKKNFPSITQREFLLEFFGGAQEYKKDTLKWLKEIDMSDVQDVAID